jgi:glycosyltransferase involved in cell wall biosynthesis
LKLLLVGDGPLMKALSEQAREEGIHHRVTFMGTREDIPDLLAGADVHVCTSDSEGMNNALLEAMAAGLPNIVTDVGDNARVVRNGEEGVVIPPRSSGSLAQAIVQLARDSSLRSRLAASARRRAHQYDFRHTVGAHERYYRALLGDRTAAPIHPMSALSLRSAT